MKRILFLGAHPDDFEAGAGGFFIKMKDRIDYFHLAFADCTNVNQKSPEEFRSSMRVLGMEKDKCELLMFPNTKLPQLDEKIRKALEKYRDEWKPDIVFTHYINNTNQDHKTVTEQVLRVFKTQSIIMYEDLIATPRFIPNLIVSLTKEQLGKKIKVLETCYSTQLSRFYHDMEYVRALARVRGKRIGSEFGEGFYIYQYGYR